MIWTDTSSISIRKKWSTILIIGEIKKLKPQWDITTHTPEWPNIYKTGSAKYWWDCGIPATLRHCWVGMQNGTTTLGKNVAVSYKIKHTPTSDPEIQLLSIYSRETENIFTKTLKGIVTEVLSIIAKNWKQSRYPSIEWIDCFIFTQQNIIQQKKKRNKLLIDIIWVKNIMLSKRRLI